MAGFSVISGGQTGADRAALDAAIAAGVAYRGFAPKDGWAEDFPAAPGVCGAYPGLTALDDPDPAARTKANVADADAVLVLHLGDVESSPGTLLTIEAALAHDKPVLALDVRREDAARLAQAWVAGVPGLSALMIAGPRESEAQGLYALARALVTRMLGGFE